jgi:signal peptidase II
MTDAPHKPVIPASVGTSGLRWLPLTVFIVIADQLSKLWVERTLLLGESIPLLPVLDLVRAHNSGAAFSFLADAGGFFTGLATVVSVGLLVWLRRLPLATHKLLVGGLTLILGGAIGNVIDRLEHGFVVDFVHVFWGTHSFPAFNLADSAISVGAALVLLDAFFEGRRERAALRGKP